MFAEGSSYSAIFKLAYERRRFSKQMVADELGMSLPTVSKGIAALMQAGLISKEGSFASTGGRPAAAYALQHDARFAIGVEVIGVGVRLAAVDLYGQVLTLREEPLPFRGDESYLDEVAHLVQSFVTKLDKPDNALLGITFGIQGIVYQGQSVSFGKLLSPGEVSISIEDFSKRLPYSLRLVHDAEAAAYAEMWRHREMDRFVYLSLNDHLGSALVVDGQLLVGGPLGAGVAEHMVLHPDGAPCYCGNHGCAETTLGAKALLSQANLGLDDFFSQLRSSDERCSCLWSRYLDDLALLVHNVRMVACCDVVVGGRLARNLTEGDMRLLRKRVSVHGSLAATPFRLVRGHFRDQATVIGAGLYSVEEFLSSMTA